jgi:adenine-specific DNA-methyltransferase
MAEIEKMDGKSLDISEEKKAMLKSLFPEVFTEGDKVDFEKLKLTLGEMVDAGRERYGLTWPGKADCFKTIKAPSTGTLLPCREESEDFDNTENLFIEGDNLEVLKLLQKPYLGKIKMIYIDPPYNTGNDFIYPDNYTENLETYLEYTGQKDSEGRRYGTNQETDGRFHSKWLNMMYPRLFLARNLLREDGVIFISIDDAEQSNLKKICDEIFGEENFIDNIIWKKRYGGGDKEKYLISLQEYALMYAKNEQELNNIYIPLSEESIKRYYKTKDVNYELRGPYRTHPLEATKSMGERKNLVFAIPGPDGQLIYPKRQWLWGKERVQNALENNELEFIKGKNSEWTVHTKQYLKDECGNIRQGKAFSIIDDVFTQHGTNEIINLFGSAQYFSFPKPSTMIQKLVSIGTENTGKEIVLDFFSGSCSSAHAVMKLNNEDGGNRKFIMVQLPEPCDESSDAYRAGLKTIADIGKERIRRVINKIKEESEQQSVDSLLKEEDKHQDLGFKVFKLASSNFKKWNKTTEDSDEDIIKSLDEILDNIIDGRSQEDQLYEILIKNGFPPTEKIEKLSLSGKDVFSVVDGMMLICLEEELTHDVVKAMADMQPSRVVCLDTAFENNDQLKTNTVHLMKAKGVEKFMTV